MDADPRGILEILAETGIGILSQPIPPFVVMYRLLRSEGNLLNLTALGSPGTLYVELNRLDGLR